MAELAMNQASTTNRPVRVLHLTAGSDAGGVSRYLFDSCQAMHQAGHEVAIAGERGAWHWLFEGAPWPWIDLPLKAGMFQLRRAAKTLARYLEDQPVDLLHCHYRRAALAAKWATCTNHRPVLFTLHLSDIPMRGLWRWLSYFGDHTHAASDDSRQWLVEQARVQPERITVIPHGVDVAKFPVADADQKALARRDLGLSSDDDVVAYVGRLENPKNEDWILDLAHASRDALPRLKALLVGEGPNEAQLGDRIKQQGLADRVRLLGHRDPLAIYQAADAVLLPSSREGFSLVCAEAMSVGRPVLRTRTAGTSELIVEGITGLSVPIDHDMFVEQAIAFLSDRSARVRMGEAAATHIRRHLTFDQQMERTLELYRWMIQGR